MLPWAVIMKTKMGGTHNERNAKTILGIKPQCTCKTHFKTLGIMALPSQYIFYLMLYWLIICTIFFFIVKYIIDLKEIQGVYIVF